MNNLQKALSIMDERFGKYSLIALATAEDGIPSVRTVNSLWLNGSFYIITDARSRKMQQLQKNPAAAVCGDWFTGQGTGENLGWIGKPENAALAARLREAFASWYRNGHVNESDPNTVILRIRLTEGTLASHGDWYHIEFPPAP